MGDWAEHWPAWEIGWRVWQHHRAPQAGLDQTRGAQYAQRGPPESETASRVFNQQCRDRADETFQRSVNRWNWCHNRFNFKAPVLLTNICLPYMHKGSRIINVCSASAFQPTPYLNLYASTKAFERSYSRALNVELKPLGITVTAACPS